MTSEVSHYRDSHLVREVPSVLALPMREGRWIALLVASALPLAIATVSGQEAPQFFWTMFVTFAVQGLFVYRLACEWFGRDEAYLASLKFIDEASLKRAATSPEVDDESRMLVVRFLNKAYPWWSRT